MKSLQHQWEDILIDRFATDTAGNVHRTFKEACSEHPVAIVQERDHVTEQDVRRLVPTKENA